MELVLQRQQACYAFRRDFQRLTALIPDDKISSGADYCGSDLMAFRKEWWTQHSPQMPDMLVGTEAWDAVFRCLVDRTQPGPHNAIRDLIYHERHGSMWENSRNRYSLPSQIYNLRLAWRWMTDRKLKPETFGIRKV
jgi:hypothetical protein